MEEIAGGAGSSEGRRRPRHRGEAKASAVPACYHRPSAGSCHHACKYGGAHAFKERESRRPAAAQPRPRKTPPPPPLAAATAMAKLRSASSRRRVGDLTKPVKAGKKAAATAVDDTGKKGDAGVVVWKDIVAYESTPLPPEKTTIAAGGGDARKKKDVSVTKGKKPIKSSPHGKSKIVAESTDDVIDGPSSKKKLVKSVGSKLTGKPPPSPELKAGEKSTPPSSHKSKKKMTTTRTNSLKPPKPKRNLVEISQQISHQSSSSSAANDIKEEKPHNPPCQEEKKSGMAPPPSPPPRPSHRRARSMSITGSAKSVRFPFTRQASRSTTTTTTTAFKVIRSRSSRAAATAAPPEDAPATTRLRFFRRGDAGGSSSGGGGGSGFHLRMRSLRRRGSIGGTAAAGGGGGFVVPAVALRHQKTLEKKRSRRLYNSVIEETAGKLAIARKSKVKALVGAFESLISKIGK